jgi:hypothetical protein
MVRVCSFCLVLFMLLTAGAASAQWASDWNSATAGTGVVSGWLAFQQNGDGWLYRFYTIDTVGFRVMETAYSDVAAYTYTFSAAERLAGEYVYSLGLDLTGDAIVEFYVMSAYGATTPYRQGFRIIDLVTNTALFERDDAATSYGYPSVWDVDNDGVLECTTAASNYPAETSYGYQVFNTGVNTAAATRGAIPRALNLSQNFPNPFNPSTRIEYRLESPGSVELDVMNVLGQRVQTLINGPQEAGAHRVQWNGTDATGVPQASGPYYYRLRVNGQPVQTKEMLLVR